MSFGTSLSSNFFAPSPRVLTYCNRTGRFFDAYGRDLGIQCGSGRGGGRNNTNADQSGNYGPLPKGILYSIGGLHRHPRLGLDCMRLNITDHSKTRRDGFLIHASRSGSTHGCIGVPSVEILHKLSNYIRQNGITHLRVIDSKTMPIPNLAQAQQPYAAEPSWQQAALGRNGMENRPGMEEYRPQSVYQRELGQRGGMQLTPELMDMIRQHPEGGRVPIGRDASGRAAFLNWRPIGGPAGEGEFPGAGREPFMGARGGEGGFRGFRRQAEPENFSGAMGSYLGRHSADHSRKHPQYNNAAA